VSRSVDDEDDDQDDEVAARGERLVTAVLTIAAVVSLILFFGVLTWLLGETPKPAPAEVRRR
jgi:hypothetical protein